MNTSADNRGRRRHDPAMFTDSHERRDWVIGLAITVIVFAGVHWLRNRPVEHPTLASRAAQATRDIAVFKLTEPPAQAHDGVRDVMTAVHGCVGVHGQPVFSDRPCGSGSAAGEAAPAGSVRTQP